MPARRFSIKHDEQTRAKIQTTQLVNRLQNFAQSGPHDPNWSKKIMTKEQVVAAVALLKKTLPDLSAVEMAASVATYVIEAPAQPLAIEDWSQKWPDGQTPPTN